MSQVDQQSRRLASMVNQLLDLSRLEAGKLVLTKETADISALVEGVLEGLRRIHSQRDFVLTAPESLPALVDGLRLEQVVTNLLDNAVKFSPPDAPVEVEVTGDGDDAVEIAVRDHGAGLPEKERSRVFERFYQAHVDWHGGLGLGLFVSRQIVELHGGTIHVEGPTGGGSRFVVRLPLR